jgi:hypothetical protein
MLLLPLRSTVIGATPRNVSERAQHAQRSAAKILPKRSVQTCCCVRIDKYIIAIDPATLVMLFVVAVTLRQRAARRSKEKRAIPSERVVSDSRDHNHRRAQARGHDRLVGSFATEANLKRVSANKFQTRSELASNLSPRSVSPSTGMR